MGGGGENVLIHWRNLEPPFQAFIPCFSFGNPLFKVEKERQDFRSHEFKLVEFEVSVRPPPGNTQRAPRYMEAEFHRGLVSQGDWSHEKRKERGRLTHLHMEACTHL